jgi:ATP-dependent Clp protease ATP-binding subunit ClpX
MVNDKLSQILGMRELPVHEVLETSEAELRARVRKESEGEKKSRFNFNMTPRQLYSELSKYVIGQEDAMRQICNSVCYHYQSLSKVGTNHKNNMLLIGPTGCGKTYAIKKIAEIVKVPVLISDATKYSGTGYVGGNTEDIIGDLVVKSEGDLNAASRGIVYLDEMDKIAAAEAMGGRDVSGRDVQNGLLKIIEGGEVKVKINGIETMFDAKDVLFIGGGAFSGLYKTLRQYHSADPSKQKDSDDGQTLSAAKPYELIKALEKFGMIPEILGRISTVARFRQLSERDLLKILTESKESPIKNYCSDFEAYGIKVGFSEDALETIAKLAHERAVGARGLQAVLEEGLAPYKFYLPGTGISEVTISSKDILAPEKSVLSLIEITRTKLGGKNGKTKS